MNITYVPISEKYQSESNGEETDKEEHEISDDQKDENSEDEDANSAEYQSDVEKENEEKKEENLSSVVKSTGKWINHTHALITNMQMDNVLQKRLPSYTGKETTTARKLLQEYNNVSSMVLYSHVPPTKNCHLSPNFGNLLHPAPIFSGALRKNVIIFFLVFFSSVKIIHHNYTVKYSK